MTTTEIIGIPLGTRLQQIVLHNGCVHVWTAVATPRPRNYNEWRGTFICVEPSGRVTRVTRDTHLVEDDVLEIKGVDT